MEPGGAKARSAAHGRGQIRAEEWASHYLSPPPSAMLSPLLPTALSLSLSSSPLSLLCLSRLSLSPPSGCTLQAARCTLRLAVRVCATAGPWILRSRAPRAGWQEPGTHYVYVATRACEPGARPQLCSSAPVYECEAGLNGAVGERGWRPAARAAD